MSKYYGLIMPTVFPTGVFIESIKQTVSSDESEGVNTMTVTLTNHQKVHFNVKNGKKGSSAEATEQMEQHAKDYIARELAGQKAALEQAIEMGKADINSSAAQANTDLQQEVSEAEKKLSALIQAKERALQDKVQQATTDITGKVDKAKQDVDDKVQQGLADIDDKVQQAHSSITTTETAGAFGFYIDENTGDLMLSYSGKAAPNMTINEKGELIYTY